jgi:hypothetical protein
MTVQFPAGDYIKTDSVEAPPPARLGDTYKPEAVYIGMNEDEIRSLFARPLQAVVGEQERK